MIKLNQIFCKTELKNIENIKKQIESAENALKIQIENNNHLTAKVMNLEVEMSTMTKDDTNIESPAWLNQKIMPYQPVVKITDNYLVPIPPQDIFARTHEIKKLVKEQKWAELISDNRLVAIWKYVCGNVYWVAEERENFQFPVVTLERKAGDCDDSASLFVTLARESGIPADMVFLAMGYLKSGVIEIGHAYPIAIHDGKWKVFDTTLHNPKNPEVFKGSNYRCPNSGTIKGLYNDVFAGVIRDGEQI